MFDEVADGAAVVSWCCALAGKDSRPSPPWCCASAEEDSRPSPALPTPSGGVLNLSPGEGLVSVLLIGAEQHTTHSFVEDR